MEFLLVGLIDRFRAEGKRAMSLGLAPLANIDGDSVPERALRLLRGYGGAAFSFGGLTDFKARWDPVWEPRYLAYPSQLDLPRVGVAVGRAGELADPTTVGPRALALVRRLPFSTALIAVELWLMTATSIDPGLERFLLRRFGVSWPSLLRLQWWRLITSIPIETRAGFVWGNVVLVALVPIVEWRLGSKRTVTCFFLGDFLATVPILAGLRLLGAFGSAPALAATLRHDAGASAASYAVLAALAVTLPGRRWRVAAVGVVFLSIAGPLLAYPRLFDVQHFVAAAIGVGFGWVWSPEPTWTGRRQAGPTGGTQEPERRRPRVDH
jgi:hypothetical protein